ncbi:MAG: hypothetical protein AAF497_15450 [Planctomycetota bacterium]
MLKKCFIVAVALTLIPSSLRAEPETSIELYVDATNMSRHLLHSKLVIPVEAGRQSLWFPKWIPGIHGPGRQVKNVAGLIVTNASGERLKWERDDQDLYRFFVDVPEGSSHINVEMTYLANQPTTLSRSVDSYGNRNALIINFNTCLLYPDGVAARDVKVNLRCRFPEDWTHATALQETGTSDNVTSFEPVSLETLIDSPLIAGRHYRRLDVPAQGENAPAARMHFVGDSQASLEFDKKMEEGFINLFAEAYKMFGGAPYAEYDFLVVASDDLPNMGLEHLSSSLNGIDENSMITDSKKSHPGYLLPHELVHAWCGKYRRPAGMYRDAYHTTKDTRMLWIYEGLTQYLGQVLAVRSRLVRFNSHTDKLAEVVADLEKRKGRDWRSLEDTAISAHLLRGGSNSWNDLRRSQDYYNEGALFWLEVDTILREAGHEGIDQFCRDFFKAEGDRPVAPKPYELTEVIERLNEIHEFDWAGFIRHKIQSPQVSLSNGALMRAGYELSMTDDKPPYISRREKNGDYVNWDYSLGMRLDTGSKKITSVTPGGPADKAGLADDMKVLGVNGKTYKSERFARALEETPQTGQVELLVVDGDAYRTVVVQYDGGPRYPELKRLDETNEWLKKIYAPRDVNRPDGTDNTRDTTKEEPTEAPQ